MGVPLFGPTYKVTLFINQGPFGWSETYYWVSTDGNYNNTYNRMKLFANSRIRIASAPSYIVGVRLTRVDGVDVLQDVIAPDALPTIPRRMEDPEWPEKVWFGRASTNLGDYHRRVELPGICVTDNTYKPSQPFAPILSDKMRDPWDDFVKIVTNNNAAFQRAGRFVIRGWAKEVPPKSIVRGTYLTAVGIYFAFAAGAEEYDRGVEIHLKHWKGPGTGGVNGRARILDILPSVDPAPVIYLTSRKLKCDMSPTVLEYGTITTSDWRYYAIETLKMTRISTKKIGRAFFGQHGRRSPPKC